MSVLGNLIVRITGDNKELKNALTGSKKQLSGFGAAVQKHSATFMKTGAVMMGFAGAIAIAAIKVGKEFDKAYSKIRTGTGKTGKVLEGLKKDFRAVAKDVPNSLDEVSTAIAELNTRLGLTGKPLQAMAKQMLNLARITETDVNAVIRTSTRLFGDWGVAVEDQAETLDYLYKVSQSTGVGIDKLSDMVTTYGVQLRTVGFTMEESLALMGKWEKEGVSAEKMLGGLSMALGKFAKAQKEPEEAFRQLVSNIEEATTVGKAMELGVEALGTRAGPDFALAVREGRFAIEDFVEAIGAGTDTIEQAAEDTMTLTEKFNLLKNQAKLAVEPLSKKLMDELSPALENVMGRLEDLDEETLDNIASYTLWAMKILAVGGAFLFAMGAVAKFTTAIITAKTAIISLQASAALLYAGYAALGAIGLVTAKGLNESTLAIIDNEREGRNWFKILTDLLGVLSLNPQYLNKSMMSMFGWNKATRESSEVTDKNRDAMQGMEEASKNMAEQTDKTTGMMEDQEEAAENLTDEIDELRSSFNKLLGVLFDGINANNEYQESGWALSNAQEEVNRLAEEGKEGTREYEEAVNKLDKQLQDHITAAYEVYTSTYATREEQREAKEEALKYGKQMVETGQWGEESYLALEEQFNLSAQGIKSDIDGVVLPAFLGMYNAGKEISEMKIEPKIGLDTTEFYAKLRETGRAFGEAYAKYGLAGGGIVSYMKGGIAGSDGFSLPILTAAQGLITLPQAQEGMLAVLHPPELVLNPEQALRVLWRIANEPKGAKDATPYREIHIHNEYNEELASKTFARLFAQYVGEINR